MFLVSSFTLSPRLCSTEPPPDSTLLSFAADFFAWRAKTQPCAPDDIPRIERPDNWIPDYSTRALEQMRRARATYADRLLSLSRRGWSRTDSVDYFLLQSAVERVRWELDILRAPHRNPDFYVQQTLGSIYELLLINSPMTQQRLNNILIRLQAFPTILLSAQETLTEPVGPFADLALGNLENVRESLLTVQKYLAGCSPPPLAMQFSAAIAKGVQALEAYAAWIRKSRPAMIDSFVVGPEAYSHFLRTVALNPLTPEEMLLMGRTEFQRAVTCEALEFARQQGTSDPPVFPTVDAQIQQAGNDEIAIRDFLMARDLLTVPFWLQHYRNRLMPPHLESLSHMGVVDDLTSEARLTEDAVAYIPHPSSALSFFRRACAQDPRPIIIHEGVPGHYFQMALSWAHENPIRRRYFDSGANEGWGFYVEEMLLQMGLFDTDRPFARKIIYRFMRLRALRVEVDIQLALGTMSIDDAAHYLARAVPMDPETARDEAIFFASTPGQAITYQIGKLQIQQLIADARLQQGDRFSLRAIHDYIAKNGNVPIALLRWELLGLRDQVALLLHERTQVKPK